MLYLSSLFSSGDTFVIKFQNYFPRSVFGVGTENADGLVAASECCLLIH